MQHSTSDLPDLLNLSSVIHFSPKSKSPMKYPDHESLQAVKLSQISQFSKSSEISFMLEYEEKN